LLANLLGVGVIVGLYFFDYRRIQPYSKYIYAATLLILVYVVNSGTDIWGARLWLTVGPVSFNFVEMSLFLLIIALAGLLDNWAWQEPKKVLAGLTLGIVPAIFMFKAPAFATGVVYLGAFTVLILVSGVKLKYLPLMVGSAIGLILFELFYEPLTHSAGLFGLGANLGPTVIPDEHTDFVFTYIVHAFGWMAGIILAALMVTFLLRLIRTALQTKNSYGKLLVSGFVAVFAIQFFWHILMNLSLGATGQGRVALAGGNPVR